MMSLPLSVARHAAPSERAREEAASEVRPRPEVLPEGLERPRFLGFKPRSRAVSLALRVSVPVLLLFGWWYGCSSRSASLIHRKRR